MTVAQEVGSWDDGNLVLHIGITIRGLLGQILERTNDLISRIKQLGPVPRAHLPRVAC